MARLRSSCHLPPLGKVMIRWLMRAPRHPGGRESAPNDRLHGTTRKCWSADRRTRLPMDPRHTATSCCAALLAVTCRYPFCRHIGTCGGPAARTRIATSTAIGPRSPAFHYSHTGSGRSRSTDRRATWWWPSPETIASSSSVCAPLPMQETTRVAVDLWHSGSPQRCQR